jgi:hypothetical protein
MTGGLLKPLFFGYVTICLSQGIGIFDIIIDEGMRK